MSLDRMPSDRGGYGHLQQGEQRPVRQLDHCAEYQRAQCERRQSVLVLLKRKKLYLGIYRPVLQHISHRRNKSIGTPLYRRRGSNRIGCALQKPALGLQSVGGRYETGHFAVRFVFLTSRASGMWGRWFQHDSNNGGGSNGGGSPLPAGTELLYVGDNVGVIHGFGVDPGSGKLTPISTVAVTNQLPLLTLDWQLIQVAWCCTPRVQVSAALMWLRSLWIRRRAL